MCQLSSNKADALRRRVYQYSDRFSEEDTILLMDHWETYWGGHTYEEYTQEEASKRVKWKAFVNWIEEVAAIYNKGLIDRDIAAETMGVYVEKMWRVGRPYVIGIRADGRRNPWLFNDWERMQADTLQRRRARQSEIALRFGEPPMVPPEAPA